MLSNDISVALLSWQRIPGLEDFVKSFAEVREVIVVGKNGWDKRSHRRDEYLGRCAVKKRTINEFLSYCSEEGYGLVSVERKERPKADFIDHYPEKPLVVVRLEKEGIPTRILEQSATIVELPPLGGVHPISGTIAAHRVIQDWSLRRY